MFLAPREMDKLYIFMTAELARKRRDRGLKLNYVESVALIADHILEGARDGRSVSEPGVPELVQSVQVEATFEDGTKLVTVHSPII